MVVQCCHRYDWRYHQSQHDRQGWPNGRRRKERRRARTSLRRPNARPLCTGFRNRCGCRAKEKRRRRNHDVNGCEISRTLFFSRLSTIPSIFSQSNFNFLILHHGPRRTFCIKTLFLVSSATFFLLKLLIYFLTIWTLDIPYAFSVYTARR